jgi:hypothetical protein
MLYTIALAFFLFVSICCFFWLLFLGSLKTPLSRNLNIFLKYLIIGICLLFIVIVLVEIKPWFDEYVAIGLTPSWAPVFLSADPASYLKCSLGDDFSIAYLYSVYGPCLFLKLFSHSFLLIFIFFLSSFLALSVYFVGKYKIVGWYFLSLLILNPWVLIQFTIPNKEIFMILSLYSFLASQIQNNRFLLSLSILFSMFSKVEFFVTYIGFLMVRRLNPRVRGWILLVLVFGASVFYKYIPGMSDKSGDLTKYQTNAEFGFTNYLNSLCQDYFLFAVAAIPRIFLNIFEKTKGYVFSGNPITDEISFVIDVSSEWIFFLALALALLKKKILNLKDDRSFLFWLFLVFVATVPFPVFRYILPIYVIIISFVLDKSLELERG